MVEVLGLLNQNGIKIMKLYYSKNGYLIKWDDLTQLKNGDYLFYHKLFDYDKTEIEISFPNLLSGRNMFRDTNLTSFSGDLSSLVDGSSMYYLSTSLTSFSGDLSNLVNGEGMFEGCTNLTLFTADLPKLTNGYGMFQQCYKLKSFSSKLPSLTDGSYMFFGCSFSKFKGVLNSLTNARCMFVGCTSLENIGDYPFNTTEGQEGGLYAHSLETANYMFDGCSNLKTLHFDINKIKDINNLGLDTCSNLQSVSMSLSNLTVTPTCFRNKEKLTQVILNVSNLTSVDQMFAGCNNLVGLSLTCPKVSEVRKMFSTENGFGNLKTLALMDLSGQELAQQFFSNNTNLTNVILGKPKRWVAAQAFYNCKNLISFDGYNLDNVTNCHRMFEGCSKLKTVTLRHCGNNNELSVSAMFNECNSLETFNTGGTTAIKLGYHLSTNQISNGHIQSLDVGLDISGYGNFVPLSVLKAYVGGENHSSNFWADGTTHDTWLSVCVSDTLCNSNGALIEGPAWANFDNMTWWRAFIRRLCYTSSGEWTGIAGVIFRFPIEVSDGTKTIYCYEVRNRNGALVAWASKTGWSSYTAAQINDMYDKKDA